MNRSERVKRIVLLLAHRLDYLPTTRVQRFPSKPGAVAVKTGKVPCGCGAMRIIKRGGEQVREWVSTSTLCHYCKGTGWRSRRWKDDAGTLYDPHVSEGRTRDDAGAIYDPYVYGQDRQSKTVQAGVRFFDSLERDAEIARLENVKRQREHPRSCKCPKCRTDSYGWERARERRDRSGSFKELDAALEALGIANPMLRAMLDNIFKGVYGPPGEAVRDKDKDGREYGPLRYTGRIPRGAEEAWWEALLFLEARMPDPVRVPQFLIEPENAKKRDESVAETYKRTGSLKQTAFKHNMRKQRVKTILGLD